MNVCGRLPRRPSVGDRHTINVLHKTKIDIFCSWYIATAIGLLGQKKEILRRAREGWKLVTFPEINAWPVGGNMGIGVSIQILEKFLCKGRNGRDYLQFNTVCQLRAAASYVSSSTSMDHASIHSLKSHMGSVLHMYEVDMKSALIEIFSKVTRRRMSKDPHQNKPINSLVVNYMLSHIKHEWLMPDTEPCRKK